MKPLFNPLGNQTYRQGFRHGQKYPMNRSFGSLQGQRHLGTDWIIPIGRNVYAPEDGVISRLYSGQGGNTIVLEGTRYIHRLMHLSEYKVSVNQFVKKGQLIGISGNTGVSTTPHLHWDVWDKYHGPFNHLEFRGFVDPLNFHTIKELPKPPINEEKPMTTQETRDIVESIYWSFGHRKPDTGGVDFWVREKNIEPETSKWMARIMEGLRKEKDEQGIRFLDAKENRWRSEVDVCGGK